MNKRENALIEALQRNTEETERWKSFLKENETAKENLSAFQKQLSVDVMVPVGKKALMPGQLIHTNEVMVGHYQDYFSKCSAHKAAEICDLRIKMAKEHLVQLETELELWQNKLEKPYAEGVMPTGEEREIIEEYNEEQENLWREQHKLRLKNAKLQEKQERESILAKKGIKKNSKVHRSTDKSDVEIFKMLEDAELMEELEQELEALDVDEVNDETIRQLMAGEINLPPAKTRISYSNNAENTERKELPLATNIIKKVHLQNEVPPTNNNVVPNPEMSAADSEEENDEEALPEEISIIKEQAKFLNPEDQIGFYEYQIEIIRQKVMSLPQNSQEKIDEKIRLFNVLEYLEELLELAETAVGNDELAQQEDKEEDVEIKEKESIDQAESDDKISAEATGDEEPKKINQKRRISFALEDETLEFCKNEAVTQMLPEKPKRDVITLDDNKEKEQDMKIIPTPQIIDKKDLIKAKVEQNIKYVSETQSKHDFDLINKIIESSNGGINTLHINFKHSQQTSEKTTSNENKDEDIPGSPADLYRLHFKSLDSAKATEPTTLFINSYEGEDQVKAPVLKESDRQQAFEDPKTMFSNPKSILRNKVAVENEKHYGVKKEKKTKKRTPQKEEECISAYYKVMNDVVEKPINEPEPLPEGKYIDAHTPKRRVSRFKQMRQGSERT